MMRRKRGGPVWPLVGAMLRPATGFCPLRLFGKLYLFSSDVCALVCARALGFALFVQRETGRSGISIRERTSDRLRARPPTNKHCVKHHSNTRHTVHAICMFVYAGSTLARTSRSKLCRDSRRARSCRRRCVWSLRLLPRGGRVDARRTGRRARSQRRITTL